MPDFSKRVSSLIADLRALRKSVDDDPDVLGSLSVEDYFLFSALVKELDFYAVS